jgi:hypothetical protein
LVGVVVDKQPRLGRRSRVKAREQVACDSTHKRTRTRLKPAHDPMARHAWEDDKGSLKMVVLCGMFFIRIGV